MCMFELLDTLYLASDVQCSKFFKIINSNKLRNLFQQLECGTSKTSGSTENQVQDDDDSSDENISYEYDTSDDDDDNGHCPANKVRDLEWDDTLAV